MRCRYERSQNLKRLPGAFQPSVPVVNVQRTVSKQLHCCEIPVPCSSAGNALREFNEYPVCAVRICERRRVGTSTDNGCDLAELALVQLESKIVIVQVDCFTEFGYDSPRAQTAVWQDQ